MNDNHRNNIESRQQRGVRRRATSLQQRQQLPPQSTSSSSRGSSGSTPLTHATRSSRSSTTAAAAATAAATDRKKSPVNSIKAIHERMARLSMEDHLPTSKLPRRRLQSSVSQQTRLIPTPLTARATKSETTNNLNSNGRAVRLRSKTATTALAAEHDRTRWLQKKSHNSTSGNLHSIWATANGQYTLQEHSDGISDNDDGDLVEAAQSRLRSLMLARERQLDFMHELKLAFGNILDHEEESGTQIIQQLKMHFDHQALYIQDLERALTRERSNKADYRRKFEEEKEALLHQQQEQFESLKMKYRVGLERIVDNWLSNETAEQEVWMDQIRRQAEDRVAQVEERWMERAAVLQAELRQYRDQNLRHIVQ
ncbi:hypothetical protein BDB00DRAFT_831988 [Zychaea mexicana]|uniref:uncharacterized protein n=1 Tax=Zychaea mexicana TaxID=64656 RepID=UPI0022FDF87D|nr:uncharacterized protein BDB00DRAFT_831988 [Zychaea mexicana]KAI9491573.1 hypothetical protein BDB00DRAFT_831988 [Zychaea mexicana]